MSALGSTERSISKPELVQIYGGDGWDSASHFSQRPLIQSAADTLSYAQMSKPFKDDKNRKQGARRNKTLKQIITAERLRAKQVTMSKLTDEDGSETNVGLIGDESMSEQQVPNGKRSKKDPTVILPVNPDVNYMGYMAIEAPPSVIPPKKYCDVTGLEAPYVDPKTGLRYHNIEIYELIKTFGPGVDQIYLSLRGAHTTLK